MRGVVEFPRIAAAVLRGGHRVLFPPLAAVAEALAAASSSESPPKRCPAALLIYSTGESAERSRQALGESRSDGDVSSARARRTSA